MRTDQDREAALEAERAAERQREEARRVLAGPVQVDEVRAARMRRLARTQMGDDTWEHRRSRLPVLRVPGVQDIVLSRRFNPLLLW